MVDVNATAECTRFIITAKHLTSPLSMILGGKLSKLLHGRVTVGGRKLAV